MMDWHKEARQLRAQGWKLADIGDKFGVTRERVRQVTKGIKCPVDHVAIQRANLADPEWRKAHWKPRPAVKRQETADFIRQHYGKLSASHIGKRLGISRNAVIGRARDMGLCRSKEA